MLAVARTIVRALLKQFLAVTAWWLSLLFTSLGVALLLVKGIVMGTFPGSLVTVSYGIITILALLLNQTSVSLKSKAANVFELLMSTASPLLYWGVLLQARFRHKPRLLE
jgi:hypothetical protein